MYQISAPVISNAEVMPRVYLLRVEAPEITAHAHPGQFVTVRCGEGPNPLLRRPFSIHRTDESKLALLFEVVGPGTEWLSDRKPGDTLDLLGPLGNGFNLTPSARNLLLVAGGIGIAPLVFLAERAAANGYYVKIVTGAKTASQVYSDVEGAELIQVTEDGSAGEKGMATDVGFPLVEWADQVFACGPGPMYRTMAKNGMGDGKPVQVLLEEVMGCGVGACRGCAIPTNQGMKMVCRDGPVFELRDVAWDRFLSPNL
ncbi:MAG: dihydroorotate dehydrogenase electron transfer subunit [Dehalococcoidia bacterium]